MDKNNGFSDIQKQAERLANTTWAEDEHSRIDGTFAQVLQTAGRLQAPVTQTGTSRIAQAQILLAAHNIDVTKLAQMADSICLKKSVEPLKPIDDINIERFLKNERENSIQCVIDEVDNDLDKSMHRNKWEHIRSDWNLEKIRLLNSFVGPSQNFIDLKRLAEQTILHEPCEIMLTGLSLYEQRYSVQVHEYNDIVLKGGHRPNLLQIFQQASQQSEKEAVHQMWSALLQMVDKTLISHSNTTDPLKTREELQAHCVFRAKMYLEQRYKHYMIRVVQDNLNAAHRADVPLITYQLIIAYVSRNFNIQNKKEVIDLLHSLPLWPLVYYAMRCGEPKIAVQYLYEAGQQFESFRLTLENQMDHPDQKIDAQLDLQLKHQYFKKVRNCSDLYKKICYCILLGFETNEKHLEDKRKMEDFLWLQLSRMFVQQQQQPHRDPLSFRALQTLILEKYGEAYCHAREQPGDYFQLLVLTAQFETAIEFLSRNNDNLVDAVHMAIALNELGILGAPRSVDQPLLSVDIEDQKPLRRLNLARLIKCYVNKFKTTDIVEALHYYFFLRNLKNSEGKNLFVQYVSELIIETDAYELIIGKLDPNGSGQINGGILKDFHLDTTAIATKVADEYVQRSQLDKAVLLYDLAGLHQLALKHLSTMLSNVVHQMETGWKREFSAIEARKFYKRIKNHQITAETQTQTTFCLLFELLLFFDYFAEEKYQLALEVVSRTKLLPLRHDEVDECFLNFKSLPNEVCKLLPNLNLFTMTILYRQYVAAKMDKCNEQLLRDLRESAKFLINAAGKVPFRMPGDTNRRLLEMEILMH